MFGSRFSLFDGKSCYPSDNAPSIVVLGKRQTVMSLVDYSCRPMCASEMKEAGFRPIWFPANQCAIQQTLWLKSDITARRTFGMKRDVIWNALAWNHPMSCDWSKLVLLTVDIACLIFSLMSVTVQACCGDKDPRGSRDYVGTDWRCGAIGGHYLKVLQVGCSGSDGLETTLVVLLLLGSRRWRWCFTLLWASSPLLEIRYSPGCALPSAYCHCGTGG